MTYICSPHTRLLFLNTVLQILFLSIRIQNCLIIKSFSFYHPNHCEHFHHNYLFDATLKKSGSEVLITIRRNLTSIFQVTDALITTQPFSLSCSKRRMLWSVRIILHLFSNDSTFLVPSLLIGNILIPEGETRLSWLQLRSI